MTSSPAPLTATAPIAASAALADGAVRLSDWGVIRAEGADAATFLHGQLTQDITGLRDGEARLAGYCSAKGRLLASFVVWRSAPDLLHLACSADLLPATLKRLSMFVLRAKCKLSAVGDAQALWGVAGASARQLLGAAPVWSAQLQGDQHLVRLPDVDGTVRALLLQAADAAAPVLTPLALADWQQLEVRSGITRVVGATVEQFVPQMVNLELVGGVNFKKGCYPGQEVVARSQYRGTLKRRVQLFESDALLAPGQEVFHSADPGQPAGLVALAAARSQGGSAALVEVKLAALADGSLHAGAADGPLLSRAELPYALPADGAA